MRQIFEVLSKKFHQIFINPNCKDNPSTHFHRLQVVNLMKTVMRPNQSPNYANKGKSSEAVGIKM